MKKKQVCFVMDVSFPQVNVPQGRDKKMSVDGAKPKVLEDLINRLLSRAEHSNLCLKRED
jgi:hypothetical protein